MNYLLDTCVISDYFKKIPSVINHFQDHAPKSLYISTITIMEIEYGLSLNPDRASKIRSPWEALINYIQVLDYSQKCSNMSASVRAILKKSGSAIGPYDVLIAGTALAHRMIMVTSNTNEFSRIPNLTLEDWRI